MSVSLPKGPSRQERGLYLQLSQFAKTLKALSKSHSLRIGHNLNSLRSICHLLIRNGAQFYCAFAKRVYFIIKLSQGDLRGTAKGDARTVIRFVLQTCFYTFNRPAAPSRCTRRAPSPLGTARPQTLPSGPRDPAGGGWGKPGAGGCPRWHRKRLTLAHLPIWWLQHTRADFLCELTRSHEAQPQPARSSAPEQRPPAPPRPPGCARG